MYRIVEMPIYENFNRAELYEGGVGIDLHWYNPDGTVDPERRLRHAIEINGPSMEDQIGALRALLLWAEARNQRFSIND